MKIIRNQDGRVRELTRMRHLGQRIITDEGLTLIEVMIAMLVFSIGILSVAQMQVSALNCHGASTRKMYDTVAAGARVEDILSWEYEDPRLIDVDQGFNPDHPDHGPFPIPATHSTVEWEVADDFSGSGIKRISVTVRWMGKGAIPMAFSFGYMKSNLFR